MNRETWLIDATTRLAEKIGAQGAKLPEVRVSVGFPKTGGKGNSVIGQCWAGEASEDKRPQIFIHPTLTESTRVLDVLLHELVHATLGAGFGHGKEFKHLATALGLTGKMTATTASEDLKIALSEIVTEIGEYPHAKLDANSGTTKKQSTRMIKCTCEDCGYIAYTTRKWLEISAPLCPCSGDQMTF